MPPPAACVTWPRPAGLQIATAPELHPGRLHGVGHLTGLRLPRLMPRGTPDIADERASVPAGACGGGKLQGRSLREGCNLLVLPTRRLMRAASRAVMYQGRSRLTLPHQGRQDVSALAWLMFAVPASRMEETWQG